MARIERGSAAARGASWLLLAVAVGCDARKSGRRVNDDVLLGTIELSLASDGSGLVVGRSLQGTSCYEFGFDPTLPAGKRFAEVQPIFDRVVLDRFELAAGLDGVAHLLFDGALDPNAQSSPLFGATRTVDGWSAPTELGAVGTFGDFTLDGDGEATALAAWIEPDGALLAAIATPGVGFGPPTVLRDGALGAARSARVAWRGGSGCVAAIVPDDGEGDVQLWSFEPLQGFVDLGVVDVAASARASSGPFAPAVALAPSGERSVTWTTTVDGGDRTLVQLRRHVDGAGWLPLEEIAESSSLSLYRVIDYHADGRLALAWDDGDAEALRVARSTAPGSWGTVEEATLPLTNPANWEVALVFESDGAWTAMQLPKGGAETPEVLAQRQDASGALGNEVDLGAIGSTPQAAELQLAAGGPAVVATWLGEERLEAYVWLPPTPRFVVDPAVPAPGALATLDARTTVIESDPPATLWSAAFDLDDDGSFETVGPRVDHVFPTAGIHRVGVRVVDSWGRVTAAVKEVQVEVGGGGGPDVDPPWELVVTVTGNGTVTSDLDSDADGSPDIDCPADCIESYFDGTVVFLSPRPAIGHHFVRWEGLSTAYFDGDYGAEGCLVQMKADRAITAVFAAD